VYKSNFSPLPSAGRQYWNVRTLLGPYSVTWDAGDPVQAGRLFRGGAPASGKNGSFPGLASSVAQLYELYTFTNAASGTDLITVSQTGSSDGNSFFSAWWLFNPADLTGSAANYLGDAGFTYPPDVLFPQSFSLLVPGHTTFFIVANSIDGIDSRGGAYTFTVTGTDVVAGSIGGLHPNSRPRSMGSPPQAAPRF
jgi:hypothetical protein